MMRKRGANSNGNNKSAGGNSSSAASKLLQQQQQNHRDGQSIILDVREPVLAGNNSGNGGKGTASVADDSNTSAQLNAKNYRLAKELSEVRIRHREECKNVTRLTMENMNLASRCREAITQAANMKKDLLMQKRKTAEAVSQTHLLLDQLKKMKHQQQDSERKQILTIQTTPQNKRVSVADEIHFIPAAVPPELKHDTECDPIAIVVAVDHEVNSKTDPPEKILHTASSYDMVTTPTTTSFSETIPTTPSSDVDDVMLPNMNNMIYHEKHDVTNVEEQTVIDETLVSPLPSRNSNLVIENTITTAASSTVCNVVDLDVSYDFVDDNEDNIKAPIAIVDTELNTNTEPSPLSPPDTTRRTIEHNDDLTIPNNRVSKALLSLNDCSINEMITPTNMDENFFQNHTTTMQQERAETPAVDVTVICEDIDVINLLNKQIKSNDKDTPPKKTVLSYISTNPSEEEDYFDDSEHKCDDTDSLYVSESSPSLKLTKAATDHQNNLVSSDDYEGSSIVEENDVDFGHENIGSDNNNMDFSSNTESMNSATTESHDDTLVELQLRNPMSKSSPLESSNGNENVDEHTDVATPPKSFKDTSQNDVNEKESKDSWLEDYDEAAILSFDDETTDTLSGLINSNSSPTKTEYFPHSASPKISIESTNATSFDHDLLRTESSALHSSSKKRFILPPPSPSLLNESYEEEFPSDIIERHRYSSNSSRLTKSKLASCLHADNLTEEMNYVESSSPSSPSMSFLGPLQERSQSTNLISSIDAFEASFQTNFPESFTPKESPSTSPSSGIKPIVDVSTTTTKNPFLSNSSQANTSKETIVGKINQVVTKMTDDVRPTGEEEVKTWSSGIRGRATAVFQRTTSRRNANSNSDVTVGEVLSNQPTILPTQTAVSSPLQQTKSNATVHYVSDQSARWLMEVKASTEKHKCSTEASIDETATRLEATKIQTPFELKSMSESVVDVAELSQSKSVQSLSITTIPPPQESTRAMQNCEPIFRQFPGTLTPAKPIKHITSRTSRINIMDDTPLNPVNDKAPVLQCVTTSDEYYTPAQENLNGDFNTIAQSRYVGVVGQTQPSHSSERGRSSIFHLKNEKSISPCAANIVPTPPINYTDRTDGTMTSEGDSLTVNVRERAAMYSNVSSPPTVVSPTKYISRSNFRGTVRSTVKLLEDEGDIPMQTSLSPRKLRNNDYSYPPASELPVVNLNKISEPYVSTNGNSTASTVEGTLRNFQLSTTETNAKVLEHHDRRVPHVDIGKQRRHINLSGSGRLMRHVDCENDTPLLHENDHRP